MQAINHEILVWARETANLTREEAVKKLGIRDTKQYHAVDWLIALENGSVPPSRPMLVKMAKNYRRSLVTFYLDKPPKPANRGVDFRTLPHGFEDPTSKLLDALLRDLRVRQSMVRAVLEDEDDVENLSFVGANDISEGESSILKSLQDLLDVDIHQFRAPANPRAAFSQLRDNVERRGIFVLLKSNLGDYKTEIDAEIFRGFVIADEIAPFIVINEQDALPAWSFTLLHELVHLILGHTGISGPCGDNKIEQFCNHVASEFLLPIEELRLLGFHNALDFQTKVEIVDKFARKRHLSRRMVAHAAYRNSLIDQETNYELSKKFRNQRIKARNERKNTSESNDYAIHQHQIGHGLINLVHRMMTAGNLTATKAAKILGVKPQCIQVLFDHRSLR